MNMILLKLCLFSVIMLSAYQHSENKKIVVIGKALNCKAGAAVIKADDTPYYVDGMDSWDKKFYGKKVKVSGTLVIIRLKKPSNPLAVVILEQKIIKKPKWELVE
ncbi:MAG TPA: hypothetical protein VK671_12030 [Mucilaginibacter sp.]|nr:hypothetical protein [Mucilaginibacter sp.]